MDFDLFPVTLDDTRPVVVRTRIHAQLWQVAVLVALYGSGQSVSQHVQTTTHGVFVPRQQFFARRNIVVVSTNGVHSHSVFLV